MIQEMRGERHGNENSSPGKKISSSHHEKQIVISLMLPYITHGALLFVLSVFFKPLEEEFGWDRTVISSGYTAFLACYGISAIIMGRILDKHGYRLVLILTAFVTGSAIIALSQVNNIHQFRFLMVMVGLGEAGCFVVPTTLAQRWFQERRAYILGIITSGFGIGTAIFAPLIEYLISSRGWRQSYAILGGYVLVSLLISTLAIRKFSGKEQVVTRIAIAGDAAREPVLTSGQVLRTHQYGLILGASCLGIISFSMMQVHLVPYAVDSGISAAGAAAAVGLIGGISIPIRLGIGFIHRMLGWRKLYILAHILMAVAVIVALRLDSKFLLYAYVVILGTANAIWAPALPGLLGNYFGMMSLGTIIGISMGGTILMGGIFGPLMGGMSYDITQSYVTAFVIALVIILIAIVLLILAMPPKTQQTGEES